MTKQIKLSVRPAKTQISLGSRPVWSVFAVRSTGSWGPDVSSCANVILLVLSWGGSFLWGFMFLLSGVVYWFVFSVLHHVWGRESLCICFSCICLLSKISRSLGTLVLAFDSSLSAAEGTRHTLWLQLPDIGRNYVFWNTVLPLTTLGTIFWSPHDY